MHGKQFVTGVALALGVVAALLPSGEVPTALAQLPTPFNGGIYVAAGDVDNDGRDELIQGFGPGHYPSALIANPLNGAVLGEHIPFPLGFQGGVRVASGDVNNDGFDDVITAAGPGGGPHVRVFSGATGATLHSFFAYTPGFSGGVYVAAGDIDGDGRADIITGAGAGGGPHVLVFSGATGQVLASFFAYAPAFTGGVQVASGDMNADGRDDIITGAGPGGGPHVRVLDGTNLADLRSFHAYTPGFTGGVYVAAGDVNGDRFDDLITGAGAGGGPHVIVFNSNPVGPAVLSSFFAYSPLFPAGVRVAAGDINNDATDEIITGAGPGGTPHVRVFRGDGSEIWGSLGLR